MPFKPYKFGVVDAFVDIALVSHALNAVKNGLLENCDGWIWCGHVLINWHLLT